MKFVWILMAASVWAASAALAQDDTPAEPSAPRFLDAEMYLKRVARTACTAALPPEVTVEEDQPDFWGYDPRTLVGAIRVPVVQDGTELELWCHIDFETEDFFFYDGTVTPWEDLDRAPEIDPKALVSLFIYDGQTLGDLARRWCAEVIPGSAFEGIATTGSRVEFADPAQVTVTYLAGDSEETLQDVFLCHVSSALGRAMLADLGTEFPAEGWPEARDLVSEARPVYRNEGLEAAQ